jgi:hypothetical protein
MLHKPLQKHTITDSKLVPSLLKNTFAINCQYAPPDLDVSTQFMEVSTKLMKVLPSLWKFYPVYGSFTQFMEVLPSLWKFYPVYGS